MFKILINLLILVVPPIYAENGESPPDESGGTPRRIDERVKNSAKLTIDSIRQASEADQIGDAKDAMYKFGKVVKADQEKNSEQASGVIGELDEIQKDVSKLREVLDKMKRQADTSGIVDQARLDQSSELIAGLRKKYDNLLGESNQLMEIHHVRGKVVNWVLAEWLTRLRRPVVGKNPDVVEKEIKEDLLVLDNAEEKNLKEVMTILLQLKADIRLLENQVALVQSTDLYKAMVFLYSGPTPVNGRIVHQKDVVVAPATVLSSDLGKRLKDIPNVLEGFIKCLKTQDPITKISPYEAYEKRINALGKELRESQEAKARAVMLEKFPGLKDNRGRRLPAIVKHETALQFYNRGKAELHALMNSQIVVIHTRTAEPVTCDMSSPDFISRLSPGPKNETGFGSSYVYLDSYIFWQLVNASGDYVTKQAFDNFARRHHQNQRIAQLTGFFVKGDIFRRSRKSTIDEIDHWFDKDLAAVGNLYEDVVGAQMILSQKEVLSAMEKKRIFGRQGVYRLVRHLVSGASSAQAVTDYMDRITDEALGKINNIYHKVGVIGRLGNDVAAVVLDMDARDLAGVSFGKMKDLKQKFVDAYEDLADPCKTACLYKEQRNERGEKERVYLGEDIIFANLKSEDDINKLFIDLYGGEGQISLFDQFLKEFHGPFNQGLTEMASTLELYRAVTKSVILAAIGVAVTVGTLGMGSKIGAVFICLAIEITAAAVMGLADIHTGRDPHITSTEMSADIFAAIISAVTVGGLNYLTFAIRRSLIGGYFLTKILVSRTVVGSVSGATAAGFSYTGAFLIQHMRFPRTAAEIRGVWMAVIMGGVFGGAFGLGADVSVTIRTRHLKKVHALVLAKASQTKTPTPYADPYDNPSGYYPFRYLNDAGMCTKPFKFPDEMTRSNKTLVRFEIEFRAAKTRIKDYHRTYGNAPADSVEEQFRRRFAQLLGEIPDVKIKNLGGPETKEILTKVHLAWKKIGTQLYEEFGEKMGSENFYKALVKFDEMKRLHTVHIYAITNKRYIRRNMHEAFGKGLGERIFNVFADGTTDNQHNSRASMYQRIAQDIDFYFHKHTGKHVLSRGFNFNSLTLKEQKTLDTITAALMLKAGPHGSDWNAWEAMSHHDQAKVIARRLGLICDTVSDQAAPPRARPEPVKGNTNGGGIRPRKPTTPKFDIPEHLQGPSDRNIAPPLSKKEPNNLPNSGQGEGSIDPPTIKPQ